MLTQVVAGQAHPRGERRRRRGWSRLVGWPRARGRQRVPRRPSARAEPGRAHRHALGPPCPAARHRRPHRPPGARPRHPRQAPAHPLHRRPHAPHAPADGRLVDRHRPRQAAAPTAHARRPGRARGRLRRHGVRRAAAGRRPGADLRGGDRDRPPRARPAARRLGRGRGGAPARGRPVGAPRRRDPGPDPRRRLGQPVGQRAVLPARPQPVDADRGGRRAGAGAARRQGAAAVGEGARRLPGHDRQHPPRRAALRGRPGAEALPAVRHRGARRRRRRQRPVAAPHLVVPDLSARPRARTPLQARAS